MRSLQIAEHREGVQVNCSQPLSFYEQNKNVERTWTFTVKPKVVQSVIDYDIIVVLCSSPIVTRTFALLRNRNHTFETAIQRNT